jgi:hypothetical protein
MTAMTTMVRRSHVMRALLVLQWCCSLVYGLCPHMCSGHGTCGDYDLCSCFNSPDGYAAWTGNDCSLRTCPYDVAWAGPVVGANDIHPVMECSNKGVCDRVSGACDCFPNFEGVACERTVCNNDCTNRGVCYTSKQLAEDADRTYETPWDADKQVGCVCDAGFRGPDCRLVECPSGADVLKGFGNEAGRDCSGRGICNYENGVCACFAGYSGTRCHIQTTIS